MLKKTITYETFDGEMLTEAFYFNMSKAELTELELGKEGGFEAYILAITEAQDAKAIIREFKALIALTVGKRSEDGKYFLKTPEFTAQFMSSNAYSELFMELITGNTGPEFIAGVMPKGLQQSVLDAAAKEVSVVPLPREDVEDTQPAWIKEDREPTQVEMRNMTKDEMVAAFQRRLTK